MKNVILTLKNGFASVIGLMITAMIIAILVYLSMKTTPKNSSQREVDAGAFDETGLDATSSFGALESAKSKIKMIEQRQLNRPDEIKSMMSGSMPK